MFLITDEFFSSYVLEAPSKTALGISITYLYGLVIVKVVIFVIKLTELEFWFCAGIGT